MSLNSLRGTDMRRIHRSAAATVSALVIVGAVAVAVAPGATASAVAPRAGCADENAASRVLANFGLFDIAGHGGAPDNRVSLDDLAAVGRFENGYPLELQNAANHIRYTPGLFHALDTAAHGGSGDGRISPNDIKAFNGSAGCD
ncbi:hypothetical protein [Streptomyces tremellae]